MKVEVTDPELLHELADALRRCEYRVLRSGSATLTVDLDPAPPGITEIPGAAELELDLYLRVWETTHRGARAARVG